MFQALLAARTMFADTTVHHCIVGGVDSLVNQTDVANGCVPLPVSGTREIRRGWCLVRARRSFSYRQLLSRRGFVHWGRCWVLVLLSNQTRFSVQSFPWGRAFEQRCLTPSAKLMEANRALNL